MVLEALAAVGLASNIVQFIDFTCNLLAETRQIHKSTTGSSDSALELESVAARLRQLTVGLSAASPDVGHVANQQLRKLADEASVITDEILQALDAIRLKGTNTKFKSFAHALRHVGKNKKIEKLGRKLATMQGQMNTHLLVMMSDKHSEIFHTLRVLEDENRRLGVHAPQSLDKSRRLILDAVQKLESSSNLQTTTVQDLLRSIEQSRLVDHDNLDQLSALLSRLSERLGDLKSEGTRTERDQNLLRSLCFKMMRVRESRIVAAHTNTFEWILDDQGKSNKPITFLDWTKHHDGVFWIMGKAGSGKSTLMKYLASHRRTLKALSLWAGTKRLVIAKFFFWNAGNSMQKSQEGLLRSLLFEILRQCPAMILKVFPEGTVALEEDEADAWSMTELLDSFSRLRKEAESSTRFCFFIDGLDEYEGECADIVTAVSDLSRSPNIKICASSRPWFVFQDAFGKCPMLKLEDLTRGDIAAYVNDTLGGHPRFVTLRERDKRYLDLIQQIVDKARGVFLWVFLVTSSLRRGLTNADSISDLQRRISLLPDSLEEYFRQIIGTIEEVYRNKTAKMFQYALHSPPSGPIPLIVFSYLDEEDPNFALRCRNSNLNSNQVQIRYDDTRRRLDGRTRGLLEASTPTTYTEIPTVDFLHRTVRDFFLTKDMQDMLTTNLEPGFDADLDLCKAFLGQIKLGPWYTAEDCLGSLMHHLHDAEEKAEEPLTRIVDEIERIYPSLPTTKKDCSFNNLLIEHNISYSAAERLEQLPPTSSYDGRPLLAAALRRRKRRGIWCPNAKIVALLLNKGADPNETSRDGMSVWANFLIDVYDRRPRVDEDGTAFVHILELLISHGADLEELVPIYSHRRKSEKVYTAIRVLQKLFPRDVDWLLSKSQGRDDATGGDWLMLKSCDKPAEATNGGWMSWVKDKAVFR